MDWLRSVRGALVIGAVLHLIVFEAFAVVVMEDSLVFFDCSLRPPVFFLLVKDDDSFTLLVALEFEQRDSVMLVVSTQVRQVSLVLMLV